MKRNSSLQRQIELLRGQVKKVTPEMATQFENMTITLACQSLTDEELDQVIEEITTERLGNVYAKFTSRQQMIADHIREFGHPLTDNPWELKKLVSTIDFGK